MVLHKYIYLIFLLVCLTNQFAYGQDGSNGAVSTPVLTPSPTSAALSKSIDFPVSLSSGTPGVNIPIHTLQGNGISVPISLSYNGGGIRVDEVSSWVGLGWSLNAGGVINRAIRGMADELGAGYMDVNDYIPYPVDDMSSFEQMKTFTNQANDGEPDIFSFNFGGYSGKFIIDAPGSIKLIPYQDLIIIPNIVNLELESFTVTTPDGLIYTFSEQARSRTISEAVNSSCNCNELEYDRAGLLATSWFLTKIENPITNDIVSFVYHAIETISYEASYKETLYGESTVVSGSPSTNCSDGVINCNCITTKFENTAYLDSINSSYGSVVFNSQGYTRDDLKDKGTHSQLTSIYINGQSGSELKHFDLTQHFEVSGGPTPSGLQSTRNRMYLESVQEIGHEGNQIPAYLFEYANRDNLQPRLSKNQDHWGFFNGASNSSFIPYIEILENDLNPANREPALVGPDFGSLNKVTYPTGGSVVYEYETHHFSEDELVPEVLTFEGEAIAEQNCPESSIYPVCENVEYEIDEVEFEIPSSATLISNIILERFIRHRGSGIPLVTRVELRKFVSPDWVLVDLPALNYPPPVPPDSMILILDIQEDIDGFGPGLYKMKALAAPGHTERARIKLSFQYQTGDSIIVTNTDIAGGIRVKRTETKENENDPAPQIKVYDYDHFLYTGVNYPKYYKSSLTAIPQSQCSYALCKKWIGFSNPLQPGMSNPVIYDCVRELHGENGENGMVISKFSATPDTPPEHAIAYDAFPETPWIDNSWQRGQLVFQQRLGAGGNVLQEVTNNYNFDVPTNAYEGKAIIAKKTYNVPCPPNSYPSAGANYAWEYYDIVSRWVQLQSTIEKLDGVQKITTYEYDQNGYHTNLKAINFDNSDGKTHRTEYEYAHDVGNTCMLDNYIISTPVATKKYVSNALQGGSKTNFTNCLPTHFYQILETGEELLRGEITAFTSNGLPLNYTPLGELTETYTYYPQGSGKDDLLESKSITNGNTLWTTEFDYFSNSRQTKSVKAIDGQITTYDYDDLQRLASTSQRGGAVTSTHEYSYGTPNEVSQTTNFNVNDGPPNQSTTQQMDGLGRPIATLVNGQIKEEFIYDNFGRVHQQTYLPGVFKTNQYEASPLNRQIGESYPDGSSVSILHGASGQYYKKTVTDENGHHAYSTSNIIGQQTQTTNAELGMTQYEYDDKGNLLKITPPGNPTVDGVYNYVYDTRNRLIEKSIPGAGIQSFVYNDRDLMVASRDENLKAAGRWLVTSFDVYGRPVKTGFFYDDPTDNPNTVEPTEYLTKTFYDSYSNLPSSLGFVDLMQGETGCTNGEILNGKVVGTWVSLLEGADPIPIGISTYNCIDQFGRVHKTKSNNHLFGSELYGTDEFEYQLNIADLVDESTRTHATGPSIEDHTIIKEEYEYDSFLRVFNSWHTINDGPKEHISKNFYNDKDQLVRKDLGANILNFPGPLQKVDYTYNIRGWLTEINEVKGSDGSAIIDCIVPDPAPCPPTCDYEVSFKCGILTDIYYDGGWSLGATGDMNFPYHCVTASDLEQDLENWLNTNGIVYQGVYVNSENGFLSIIITGSEIAFNSINVYTPGVSYDLIYFDRSNCDNGEDPNGEPGGPVDICTICKSYGYPCDRCPYTELQEPCKTCLELDIFGCTACELATTPCNACNNLGYADCTDCPMTVEFIRPTKVRFNYNLDALTNGSNYCSMIKIEEQSQYYLHNGLSENRVYQHTKIIGNDNLNLTASSNLNNVIELELSDLWVIESSLTMVVDSIGTLLENELLAAGVTNPVIVDEVVGQVQQSLESGWLGLTTLGPGGGGDPSGPPPPGLANPDLFAMKLLYGEGNSTVGSPAQYNGNISGLIWASYGEQKQTYGFWYDAIDRLKIAVYDHQTAGGLYNSSDKYGVELTYDAIGNILSLQRQGVTEICELPDQTLAYEFGEMDNLTYTYAVGSQLSFIQEDSNKDHGFKGDGGYLGYDANGNMTNIGYKGMTAAYNHLNLPYHIERQAEYGEIIYYYDALGTKLTKRVTGSEQGYGRFYVQGIEYFNEDDETTLEAIYFADGRAVFHDGKFRYEYYLKDHLGNTRVMFSDKDGDGYLQINEIGGNVEEQELLQVKQYYPFGMEMEGPWEMAVSEPTNSYLYNGKERDSDFGLDWDHYGFRMYDASIGRFPSADPIADKFPHVSPYNYAENEPIANIDLHGLQKFSIGAFGFSKWMAAQNAKNIAKKVDQGQSINQAGLEVAGEILGTGASMAADEIPVVGEVKSVYEGDYGGLLIGAIPGGKIARRIYNGFKHSKKLKSGQGLLDKFGGFRSLTKVNKPDAAADALADRIGGTSRVKIDGIPNEFDAISDDYIGQSTDITTLGSGFRKQAKATFGAAEQTGRDVLYELSGDRSNLGGIINKLNEYASRYDNVNIKIIFKD